MVGQQTESASHASSTATGNPWDGTTETGHAVALEVLLRGPVSRTDLARRLGLSAPTLSRVTKDLLSSEIFIETTPQVDRDTGRPTRPLDVVPESRLFVGIRLTEWEAQGVLTTLRAEVIAADSMPLRHRNPSGVRDAIVEVVDRLRRHGAISGIGVSIGGLVRDHRVVTRAPFFSWDRPVPLADDLNAQLGVPVVIDNDVAALARLHAWFGVGTTNDFCLITLGIATGYALTRQRDVIERPDIGLGVIGHLPVDPYGPLCPDGHRGCAQAMLSIAAIHATVSIALGRPVAFDDCLQLAREGHPAARRALNDSIQALGRLIALVTTTTLTDHVVIAGEAVGIATLDPPQLASAIADSRPPAADAIHLEIEPPSSEPWSKGAATAAIRHYVLAG